MRAFVRCSAVLVAATASLGEARADEPASSALEVTSERVSECQSQHERAKLLEVEQKWFEAREAMNRCAAPSCPLALRADCGAWLEELSRAWPTLLVVVERDEPSAGDVRFELDGKVTALAEPPAPLEVLPGRHRLRFALGAAAPIEREIEIARGEKNRLVRVRFPARAATAARLAAPAAARVPAPSRPVPASTYVFAAGAVTALGVSAALLVSALNSLDDARERCAPGCASDVRASIDRRLLFADIAAGAGVVLGSIAGYTFVTRPVVVEPRSEQGAPGRAPALGAAFSVRGQF